MSLLAIAIATGAIIYLIFRRTVDKARLHTVMQRIAAQFLEMRLYFDEPRIVWRANVSLLQWNGSLLRLLLLPIVIAGSIFAFEIWILTPMFGYEPLRPGEATVVSAKIAGASDVELSGSGVLIETAPVRSGYDGQISWRIRSMNPQTGTLQLDHTVVRLDQAGRIAIRNSRVEWIEIEHEKKVWVWEFSLIAGAASCLISLLW